MTNWTFNALWFVCPGCGENHRIQFKGEGLCWQWNGDKEKPTFKPSVKYRWSKCGKGMICHFHVTDGKIKFCGDCTHEIAGKTVPLPTLEEGK